MTGIRYSRSIQAVENLRLSCRRDLVVGKNFGKLDETAKFYMQSRGISEEEARLLLMFAFTNDVIENIRIPALQDRIKLLVEKRLRGELSKCEGCIICQ